MALGHGEVFEVAPSRTTVLVAVVAVDWPVDVTLVSKPTPIEPVSPVER